MAILRNDHSEIVQYASRETPVYVQRGVLSDYPNYSEIAHWHNDMEFIYVTAGAMQFNINGDIVDLPQGRGLFVNSRQLHYGFSDRIECEFICVLLDPFLLPLSETLIEKFILPITQNQACPYLLLISSPSEQEIIETIQALYAEQGSPAFALRATADSMKIASALYEIEQKTEGKPQDGQKIVLLKKMLSFLEENYAEKLTLDKIARAGSVSKSACGTLFRQFLHKTPIDYLIDYRLRKAEHLLAATDRKVTNIAFDVGFPSVSYFIETFRKTYGLSPNRFREAIPITRKE